MFSTYETETRYFSISLNKKGGDLMTEIDLSIFLDLLKKTSFSFFVVDKICITQDIVVRIKNTCFFFEFAVYWISFKGQILECQTQLPSCTLEHKDIYQKWNTPFLFFTFTHRANRCLIYHSFGAHFQWNVWLFAIKNDQIFKNYWKHSFCWYLWKVIIDLWLMYLKDPFLK